MSLAVVLTVSQAKPIKKPIPLLTGAEVVKKMRSAVRAASPVSGEIEMASPSKQRVTMSFRLMYPALLSSRITIFGSVSEAHWTKAALYSYLPDVKSFVKRPIPANPAALDLGIAGLESLFNDHNYYKGVGAATKMQFQGRPAYSVPVMRMLADSNESRKYVLFIDAKTFLPLGSDEDDPDSGGIDHCVFKTFVSHAKVTAKDFEWAPPKGAIDATGT